jgi:hypothetical protein
VLILIDVVASLLAILASCLSCLLHVSYRHGLKLWKAPVRTSSALAPVLIGMAAIGLLTGCTSSPTAAGNASSAGSSSTGSGGSASSGASSLSCPTAAEANADLGISLTGPVKKSGGGLQECDYADKATSVTMVMSITKVPGLTRAALKSAYAAEAKAARVPYQADPGLGDAAFSFTQNDASTNASGKPTAVLGILSGDTQLAMTGEVSLGGMETLASEMLKK